jgi:CubicO group peptidase (beta-lactamase class C family)
MPALRRSLRNCAFYFSILAFCFVASASAAPPKFDPDKLAAIAPAMQKFVDQHEISGAVLVIGTSDGIVYHEAIGKRTLDSDEPMPKDAIFRIMSMTKPITSLGVGILVDEGKLSFDDLVEKYLPEFKGQMLTASTDKDTGAVTLKKPARPITYHDLLTHSSGLASYPPGLTDLMRKRNYTLGEVVAMASQRPLVFEPGSEWQYCQTGMDTLGHTIEVLSGKSYEDFLAERIFKPLAMSDTGFYVSQEQSKRLAELCGVQDGKLVDANKLPGSIAAAPTEKPKFPSPAGGLYSSAHDLGRLYQALLRHGKLDGKQIISPETLSNMTRIQSGDLKCGFTPGMSWGLGFNYVREPEGVTGMLSPGTVGHGGAFGTQGWIDPVKDVFYVLLIQRVGLRNSDASDMRKEFQTLAAGAIQQ